MKITRIELLGSLFLRVIAIQSMQQLGLYIAATLIGFLIFQAGLLYFNEPIATPTALLFAFSGSSVVLRMLLPARFTITLDSSEKCASIKESIAKKIKKQGYNMILKGNEEVLFQSKLPAPLTWSENEILITRSSTTLIINGPIFMVRILHKYSVNMKNNG